MTLLEKLATFLPARWFRPASDQNVSPTVFTRRPVPHAERPWAMLLTPVIEAAISHYQIVMQNQELSLLMDARVDARALDLAKIDLADAVLRARGIPSCLEMSEIREAARLLEIRGEKQSPKREPIPQWLRWKVLRRDGYKCVECFRTWDLTVDHIIPVSKGGATVYENLRAMCRPCNSRKGAA